LCILLRFIEYENAKSAEEAIGQMNGWELGGRQIKVGRAISSTPSPTGIPTLTLPTLGNPLAVLPPPVSGNVEPSSLLFYFGSYN